MTSNEDMAIFEAAVVKEVRKLWESNCWDDRHPHCHKAIGVLLDILTNNAETIRRLEEALLEIKNGRIPQVCEEFELCTHVGCAASYAAYYLADEALRNEKHVS